MDKIKKKIIQDMLVKLGWKVEPINEFMQRLEDVMDSEYVSPDGVFLEFNKWHEELTSDQLFEVVKSKKSFTARLCVVYETIDF